MATDNREKISKLVATLRERHEQDGLLLEEIAALLGGSAGIGDTLKELEATFSELWAHRYQSRYVFTYAKDRPHWKRLIKSLGPEAIKQRIAVYLTSNQPYYVQARHGFGLFVAVVNSLVSETQAADDERPIGCLHSPPCANDVAHTKRRQRELQ